MADRRVHPAGRSTAGRWTALAGAVALAALPVRAQRLEADLVVGAAAAEPGGTVTVGVRLRIEPGWHLYWRNPGDAGLATRVAWDLPAGVSAGALRWPAPVAFGEPPVVGYGYEGETVLLADLRLGAGLAPGAVLPLRAEVEGLLCSEICVPVRTAAGAEVPLARAARPADPAAGALLARYEVLVPRAAAGWRFACEGEGDRLRLAVGVPAGFTPGAPGGIRFHPYERDVIEHGAPQAAAADGAGGFTLLLPRSALRAAPPERLRGALVVPAAGAGRGPAVLEVDVPVSGRNVGGAKGKEQEA